MEDLLGIQNLDLKDLHAHSIEKEMSKVKRSKCVEFIQVSSFNPVPADRRLKGDLLYLNVKLAGGHEIGITCTPGGFYRNDSTERSSF